MMVVYNPLLHPSQIARAIKMVDHIFSIFGEQIENPIEKKEPKYN
jgi:hypothetical protein